MPFERIYLDSNVVIRAFEDSPEDDVARDLVGMLGLIKLGQPARFVTSQITLAEVLVHPMRDGDTFLTQRYTSLLSETTPWLNVRRIDQAVLENAAKLRAQSRVKLPDAIHAATAILTGCSHIMSGDSDFGASTHGMPETIQPTRDVVDSLIAWLRT